MIKSNSLLAGQAVTDPACLKDCFAATSGRRRQGRKKGRKNGKKGQRGGKKGRETSDSDSNCLALLIDDVTSKGTCDDGGNPAFTEGPTFGIWGANDLPNDCTLE